MDGLLKEKVLSSFVWQLLQRVLTQLISFCVSVVLARMLAPADFGVVALSGMLIVLIGSFVDTGIGMALVQKTNADELDYNTVFYTNITLSSTVYVVIFLIAPLLSSLFNSPQMTPVIRVMSLGLPIGSLSGVHSAKISKDLAFKKFFFSTLSGSLLSAAVGLSMVLLGCGVWALVGQYLVSTIANTIVLLLIVRWKPKRMFSKERFKSLFSYGWKLTASSLIGTFFSQMKGYAIGLKYTTADLAYYNRGEGVPGILYNNINSSINAVLFPALSKLQNDKIAIRRALSKTMQTASFVLMPGLLGLAAVSDNFVQIVYTSKWIAVVPFMQVICLMNCFDLLGAANIQALKAVGRADTLLKLEVYKKPLMVTILVICMFISPLAIAIGQFFYSIIALVINAYPNRKYIDYPLKEQFLDISKSFFSAVVMALLVYFLGMLSLNIYLLLILQIFVGISVYVLLSLKINKVVLHELLALMKHRVLKK